MISRNQGKSFFAAHWDWLVAAGGILALLAAIGGAVTGGSDFEGNTPGVGNRRTASASAAIPEPDMDPYNQARKLLESPAKVNELADDQGSFFASARRVFCEQGDASSEKKACAQPIAFGLKVCPFCGVTQPQEKKVVLDSDGDGIPDELEKKWGLNPNDAADANADKDNDGFTNLEELHAKTDPTDAQSHPDYLNSLKLVMPLKETFLPFYLERVLPVGKKHRFFFKDPKRGSAGSYSVLTGDAIAFKDTVGYLDGAKTKDRSHDTGFVVKSLSKKEVVRKMKGSTMTRKEQVSVATIERRSDGRTFQLEAGDSKPVAVDVQATLNYERNGSKQFVKVPGDTINLHGTVYKVVSITRDGKTARVTLDGGTAGKKTLEALEQ